MKASLRFLIFGFILLAFNYSIAQTLTEQFKYRIYFKDKPNDSFDAFSYFDDAAIVRRIQQNLPLYDYYDLPLNQHYIKEIESFGAQVKLQSRWLNAAIVFADEDFERSISHMPFIEAIEKCALMKVEISSYGTDNEPIDAGRLSIQDRKVLKSQTSRMDAELLHEMGLSGSGIRICVNDVGFSGADIHPAFDHLRKNKKIIATKDFVGGGENVYRGGWHGTAVLSCIAGIIGKTPGGLATDAEFLLARTEWGNKEIFAEEENWVAAAEWADKMGARIINSSLGYTDDRYFQRDMDGKKSFITRGANIAARKGLLIINAAGNEGSGKWRIIGAPADADSVLSVGGVLPFFNRHIDFSSFGPTWDLRMKPNVSAQGTALAAVAKGVKSVDGTSFASPLVAGFAACIWQKFPEKSNMEIFRMIEKSGHLHPYFDYAHGFGVPSAAKLFSLEKNIDEPQKDIFTISRNENNPDQIMVLIHALDSAAINANEHYLYYHIADARNVLKEYYLMDVKANNKPLVINTAKIKRNSTLRVSFQGQTKEFKIN